MDRKEYEMEQQDLDNLLKVAQPVRYMVAGGMAPTSLQERVNSAWAVIGTRMRFDWMTVKPIPGKEDRFFSAVPIFEK